MTYISALIVLATIGKCVALTLTLTVAAYTLYLYARWICHTTLDILAAKIAARIEARR